MTESGAKHVVLVGRSGPNPKAVETIDVLKKKGVNVITLQADVGDYEQCQNLLEKLKDPSLGLPTLRGIMHAAGTLSDALLENQSWSKFQSTFHPKVQGGWNLHTLTRDYPLEHFVTYSSAVAILGNIGQANHSSANGYLDALVRHRRSLGLPGLTVNWGQWGEVGVAAEIKINGFRAFSPKEAILALELAMKAHKTQAAVVDADIAVISKLSPNTFRYFEDVKVSLGIEGDNTQKIDSKAFAEEFEKAEELEGKAEIVRKYLEIIVRQILKLDSEDEVDHNQNLADLGLDSLMMVEMKNSLQALVGNDIVLNPQDLANCQTVQLLGEHLAKMLVESKQ